MRKAGREPESATVLLAYVMVTLLPGETGGRGGVGKYIILLLTNILVAVDNNELVSLYRVRWLIQL